jgi:hypothetical protein
VIFYGAALLAISILFSLLWRAVARDRQLLRRERQGARVVPVRAPSVRVNKNGVTHGQPR